jgi:hypothetical protein
MGSYSRIVVMLLQILEGEKEGNPNKVDIG